MEMIWLEFYGYVCVHWCICLICASSLPLCILSFTFVQCYSSCTHIHEKYWFQTHLTLHPNFKKKLVMHEAAARACVNDAEIQINNANLGENSPSCQLSQPQLHTQRRPSWLPHLLPNHCHNFWILVWGYDPLDPPLGLKTITKMEGGVRKWHCIFI